MLTNYLKIALRHLLKQRVHSGINLLGLAIGLAGTILIALWVQRELSVNQFHENSDRLFRILEHQTYGDEIMTFGATPGPLAEKLVEDFPEITHASRSTWDGRYLVTVGEQTFYESGKAVEPAFLEMFTFPLLFGDAKTALNKPDNVLITRELAEKYFGRTDVVGKALTMNNRDKKTITGVLADLPNNSQMKFTILFPFQVILDQNESLSDWGNNSLITYFMTAEPMTSEAITAKIENTIIDNSEVESTKLHALALPDWHLRWDFADGKYTGGGRIEYVRLFGIIAIFILLIACMNFMNLSTAKSANRAIEVGVRKVTGASRSALAGQFLAESVLTVVLAGLLGAALASMTLPHFNQLFGLELSMGDAGTPFYLGMAGAVLLTGLLAGSYPALYLSGFDPTSVLKGQMRTGQGAVRLRKILVTAQFVISIALIVSSLVVYRQIEFIKDKNLGYEKENLMYVAANGSISENYDALKNDLRQMPGVSQVSATSAQLHNWGNNTSSVDWPGKDPETSILFEIIPTSLDFVETIGAEVLAGRDFSAAFPADTANYIINETAARLMGLADPVGQPISLWGDEGGKVVGMVKDFQVSSMRDKQAPVIMILVPEWMNLVYVRLSANNELTETLAGVEGIFKKHNPNYPFEYRFTDEAYEALHRTEMLTGDLAKIFASLAIFVSCLGLFGLAAFATEQRRKEIGIRKVLGATAPGLTMLVSKEFIIMVFIALALATPLAWWLMEAWLADFAYRIELNWWYFALAGVAAILVAFFTVATQSAKAALANPVESLRSE